MKRETVSAGIRAVEAAKAVESSSEVDALVVQVERQGFVARSAGMLSTANPYVDDAERASEEPVWRIRGILCSVWARGWERADQELAA